MISKVNQISLILLFSFYPLFAQSKLPDTISKDLTLKAASYESNGFTLEKGATLTLQSGTKIKFSIKPGDKANYASVMIKGTLKINGGAKPSVQFDGNPVIVLSDAKVDWTGLEGNVQTVRFFGSTTGSIKNCIFHGSKSGDSNYNFEFTVPKEPSLTFQDCLFEARGVEIHSSDFPNDVNNLAFNKCAFTSVLNPQGGKKLKQFFVPITLFYYGTKCDTYLDIEFKAFNAEFKKPFTNEWFIADEHKRKTTEDSVKSNKTFALKLPSKAFTTYKQEEVPEEKDDKKEKK